MNEFKRLSIQRLENTFHDSVCYCISVGLCACLENTGTRAGHGLDFLTQLRAPVLITPLKDL